MNKPASFALRLPRSLKEGAERSASRDGVSLNQFIAIAVAEKLSALDTADFFETRAKRSNLDRFWAMLNRPGGEPPRDGDELPPGYNPVER